MIRTVVPWSVIAPLLGAAFLTATSRVIGRRISDLTAIFCALVVTLACAALTVRSYASPIVYWFGSWEPRHGFPIGIAFVVEPLGAGLAALAGALTLSAFIFSWRYFDTVGTLFHVLMLLFLGAMVGFCLTGDLFNMFVFFELMSVSAFALTGYKIEESAPLQGALNFAISVSIGAFLILSGIGLIYARTSALNLAQISKAISLHGPDGLVIVAFVLIASGFLIKAAAVPFHFWLADVESVAPNPVCAVFSGAMVAMGVYGVTRVYWSSFADAFTPDVLEVRHILLAFATLTAVLGGVMCFLQTHLKRLLAFSTVAHVGIILFGVALLSPDGLAGAAEYVVGQGTVKASLFLGVGVLLHRFGSVAQNELHGRGRRLVSVFALFALGVLGLCGMPPFGTFAGKATIEEAAEKLGYGWATPVLLVASALTGAAVLRVIGHVFLGLGPREEDAPSETEEQEEEPETQGGRDHTPLVMIAPAVVLMLIGLGIGLVPNLGEYTAGTAHLFTAHRVFANLVLGQDQQHFPVARHSSEVSLTSLAAGFGSVLLAVGLALLSLYRQRLPGYITDRLGGGLHLAGRALRRLHSGRIGDYVTWLTFGVALFGAALALLVM